MLECEWREQNKDVPVFISSFFKNPDKEKNQVKSKEAKSKKIKQTNLEQKKGKKRKQETEVRNFRGSKI